MTPDQTLNVPATTPATTRQNTPAHPVTTLLNLRANTPQHSCPHLLNLPLNFPLLRRLLPALLALIVTLLGSLALATPPSSTGAQGAASGFETYMDVTQIFPKLTELRNWFDAIIIGMNVPGMSLLVARYIVASSLILGLALMVINYATGRNVRLMGMTGSFSQFLLSIFVIGLLATPLPWTLSGLSYEVWSIGYTSVNSRVEPIMTPLVQDKTRDLGEAVFDFTMTSLAVSTAPMQAAILSLQGQASVDSPEQLAGQLSAYVDEQRTGNLTSPENVSTFWSLGMLLIAASYLSYQIAIAVTLMVALAIGLFFPIAIAAIPFNDRIVRIFIATAVRNAIAAVLLPAIMLMNVIITFNGPVSYLTRMMKNNSEAAGDAAQNFANVVNTCSDAFQNSAFITNLISLIPGANAVQNFIGDNACAIPAGIGGFVFTLPKTALFLLLGLIGAGLVFAFTNLLGTFFYKVMNDVLKSALDSASDMTTRSNTGLGQQLRGTVNRVVGAGMALGGAATGNVAVAAAGRAAMVSGSNPVTASAGNALQGRALSKAGTASRNNQNGGGGGGNGGGGRGNGGGGGNSGGGGNGPARTSSNTVTTPTQNGAGGATNPNAGTTTGGGNSPQRDASNTPPPPKKNP